MIQFGRLAGFSVFLSVLFSPAWAQQVSLADLQSKLVGTWLGTIEGEARKRTLNISTVEEKGGNPAVFSGAYGFSDDKLFPPKVPEIRSSSQQLQISFKSAADSAIEVTAKPDGTLEGTIKYTNGQVKGIKFEKSAATVASAPPARTAQASPVLGKSEVETLLTGKAMTFTLLRNSNNIVWHLDSGGVLSARNLTSGSTDSGSWSLTERGSLCIKWRGSSTDGCSSVVRKDGKLVLTNARDQQPFADVVSIK